MAKDDTIAFKRQAAYRAAGFVASGMVVGLGTGSTVRFVLEAIALRLRQGNLERVVGVPTSLRTEKQAQELGIPLTTLNDRPILDLTIDGADEVDDSLNLIKGGGGALLREKVVAQASRRNIFVVDDSKCSTRLGTQWALPVEVIPFAWQVETDFLEALGARVSLRVDQNQAPRRTDNDNLILDAAFGPIGDPAGLDLKLNARAAIMAHGLFLELATDLIVAGSDGIRHLT